eukprot:11086970-Karenia_brevis.AAC.1
MRTSATWAFASIALVMQMPRLSSQNVEECIPASSILLALRSHQKAPVVHGRFSHVNTLCAKF